MESTLENNAPEPQPSAVPGPWKAAGWLCVIAGLHLLSIFLYLMGYGGYLGAQLASQGQSVDPQEIQAIVQGHMQTPAGIVGYYLVQFALLFPLVLLVAHFKNQSRWETLAVKAFPVSSVWRWVLLLVVFLGVQTLVYQFWEIDHGEFMQMLSGSRHLPLALVVVLVAPVLEELVFRGYLFKAWRQSRLGFSGTLLLTSLLFALVHGGQYGLVQVGMVFVLGAILGLAREKSGSVLLPMLLHALNNLVSAIFVIYLGLL